MDWENETEWEMEDQDNFNFEQIDEREILESELQHDPVPLRWGQIRL